MKNFHEYPIGEGPLEDGDHHFSEDHQKICGAETPRGYGCTIRDDVPHKVHEAGTGVGVAATWEDDDEVVDLGHPRYGR